MASPAVDAVMKLQVKVQAGKGGDFHRFTLVGTPGPDFAVLKAKIADIAQATFGVRDGPEVVFKITYLDDEQDPCVLANQEDLMTALQFLPTASVDDKPAAATSPLRLTVEQVPAPAPASIKSTAGSPQRQHGPRWHAVRNGRGQAELPPQPSWHKWAVDNYGPMPARRLAAAWAISPRQAVGKIQAAMAGNDDACKAIEKVLGRATPTGDAKTATVGASPEQGQEQVPEDQGIEHAAAGEVDSLWNPHHMHHMHHMMMKGKGGHKGKCGHKGKGGHKGHKGHWYHHMHAGDEGGEAEDECDHHLHHMMKGKGKGRHCSGGWGSGWGRGGWGPSSSFGGGGGCGKGGGPVQKLAEALGVTKQEAWTIVEQAAAGDRTAQEKIATAKTLSQDEAAELDAAWLEAKLAKKSAKMAGKSEVLAQKAAWFASSSLPKHQKKAAKLQEKAAVVQSKGEHFNKLAAGFSAQAAAAAAAAACGAAPASAPASTPASAPAPAPAPASDVTTDQDGATGFTEAFTLLEGTAVPPAPVPNDDGIELVELAEVADVPAEWADALQTMTSLMGFEPAAAAQALSDHNGNVQLAVSQLIGVPPH